MSESTAVLVRTETVGATVVVTGATIIGTVPIGPQGPPGPTGDDGLQGIPGTDGAQGDPGEGVPTGGTVGQVLAKSSGTDYDTAWVPVEVTQAELDAEATTRGNADTALDGRLDTLEAISIATDAELAAEAALARNADNLTSGTVADARIAGTIARDSEVSAAITASEAGQVRDGDTAGGVLSGTYPNPGFAVDMATQAELDTEASTRASADTALDGRLDTLEAAGPYVETVVAGTNVTVDNTDPANPVVSASGGGGSGVVESVVAGTNVDVDSTDPANPVVSMETLVDADIPASIARDSEVAAGYQPLDADLTALAAAGNSAVLAATTAAFLTTDETKLDGIEAGATADQTAAEILTAIKTVDGAGSGLDADLLDGLSSAAFATAAQGATADAAETPAGAQAKADAKVSDTAYDATSWNGVTTVAPSKNAVRDELEATATELATAISDGDASTLTSAQAYADGKVSDTAYDATSWNGDTTHAPSKNAVRDKIESLGSASIDDTAYNATSWDGVTTTAPSKNAVRDKVEALDAAKANLAGPTFTGTPAAPTAAQGTNTTQVATTAYVQTEVDLLGAYTAYVPTIKGGVTTVTTSSLVARYNQIGKRVHAYGKATVSSAGAANGAVTLTLPVAPITSIDTFAAGVGDIIDVSAAGTASWRSITANIVTSGTPIIRFFFAGGTLNGNEVGVNPAFTLASGDTIAWNVQYEAA